jgi:hypothetical protein
MISRGGLRWREPLDLVEVDQMVVGPDAVLDGVEPLPDIAGGAVGEVAPASGSP